MTARWRFATEDEARELFDELLALPPQLRGRVEAIASQLCGVPDLRSGRATLQDLEIVRVIIGQHLAGEIGRDL